MAKVLCVSFDKTVSDSRVSALKQAGYTVVSTTYIDEAMKRLEGESFDLLILGHRFPWADKRDVALYAREKCDTPVLLVCGAGPDMDIPADYRVFGLEGLEGLVETVQKMVPLKPKAKAA